MRAEAEAEQAEAVAPAAEKEEAAAAAAEEAAAAEADSSGTCTAASPAHPNWPDRTRPSTPAQATPRRRRPSLPASGTTEECVSASPLHLNNPCQTPCSVLRRTTRNGFQPTPNRRFRVPPHLTNQSSGAEPTSRSRLPGKEPSPKAHRHRASRLTLRRRVLNAAGTPSTRHPHHDRPVRGQS